MRKVQYYMHLNESYLINANNSQVYPINITYHEIVFDLQVFLLGSFPLH